MSSDRMGRDRMGKVLTAAMLMTTAGLAQAQSEPAPTCPAAGECEIVIESALPSGVFQLSGQPTRITTAGVQPEVKSRMVMIENDNDHEYKVEVADGEVKAWVDGERVPEKRVKVGDGQITIVDEDGKTIAEFQHGTANAFGGAERRIITRGSGDGPIVWESDDGGVWAAPEAGQGMMFLQPDTEHPPVMIGINMSELNPDEADARVLEYLEEKEIDPADTIVVLSVIDDLPADEAGLRDNDVIVRVGGEWGVNAEKLREILGDKEPGDSLELGVLRKGKFRELEVELAEWDAEKLGAVAGLNLQLDPSASNPMVFQWRGENDEDVSKMLQERLSELGAESPELETHLRALVEGMRKDGLDKQLRLDVMPRIQRLNNRGVEGMERFLVQPAPQAESMGGFEERLSRIEERLEGLESRLDRILEALERDDN
ncbi:MAG: PDZ domain-containing protein [Phycisphaerales bacterium]|nr:PDZ domain-containing protein [Phycisphaerales bacterium]